MTLLEVCGVCGQPKRAAHHICSVCPECGGAKSASAVRCYACAWPGREPRSTERQAPLDPIVPIVPIEPTTAPRRVQVRYRVYCVSCGRANDEGVAAGNAARCQTCGGTMLREPSE